MNVILEITSVFSSKCSFEAVVLYPSSTQVEFLFWRIAVSVIFRTFNPRQVVDQFGFRKHLPLSVPCIKVGLEPGDACPLSASSYNTEDWGVNHRKVRLAPVHSFLL